MPKIQKTGPTLGIPSPGAAGTGISQVPITSGDSGARDIIENTLNRVTDRVISDAVDNRRTDDNNHIREKVNERKRFVSQLMVDEEALTGSNTQGNAERYKAHLNGFDDGTAGQNKYTVDNLKMRYDDIDLNNEGLLLGYRQQGREEQAVITETNQMDTSLIEVTNKPFRQTFNIELADITSTINADETISDDIAQAKIDARATQLADQLLSTLVKTQPTKAMEIIDFGVYDEFFKGEEGAQRLNDLRKFALDQQKAEEKEAKRLAKENATREKAENEQAGAVTEAEWITKLSTGEVPTLTEIAEADPNQVTGATKRVWIEISNKMAAESPLTSGGDIRVAEILNDINTGKANDWPPTRIMQEMSEGKIPRGGKGSTYGALELISLQENNVNENSSKNPKLKVILQQVDKLSKNLIFVPEFTGGTPTAKQDVDNAIRHANIQQAIIERVAKGEDASLAFEAEMKPYFEEQSKGFLDFLSDLFVPGATTTRFVEEEAAVIEAIEEVPQKKADESISSYLKRTSR